MKKEIFEFLWAISFGAWIVSFFVVFICYHNLIPMFVSIIAMNVFNLLRTINK